MTAAPGSPRPWSSPFAAPHWRCRQRPSDLRGLPTSGGPRTNGDITTFIHVYRTWFFVVYQWSRWVPSCWYCPIFNDYDWLTLGMCLQNLGCHPYAEWPHHPNVPSKPSAASFHWSPERPELVEGDPPSRSCKNFSRYIKTGLLSRGSPSRTMVFNTRSYI